MEQHDSPIRLTILPENQVVEVVLPITLMEVLAEAGIALTAPCAAQGTCGKCLVQIERGKSTESLSPPTGLELELLTSRRLRDGFRLACQSQVRADTTVSIPPTSRASEMRILLGGASRKVTLEPSIVKRFVRLPPQQLEGAFAEINLLKDVLDLRADLRADYAILRELPIILQQTNRQLTVSTCEDRIIALEPGDTADGVYGLALDVGTTTVVGVLMGACKTWGSPPSFTCAPRLSSFP
ncbi:MAG: 2Fe-2S iron-sulfur cluster-binding protein [Candidatus Poribacteria bacterium]|nr:2Fe-2S iron-sulfur cluster-binding protein [Candidatus Poribacteria bacterium]